MTNTATTPMTKAPTKTRAQPLHFMGDIHGQLDRLLLWNHKNEDQTLIQVGDLGLGFQSTERDIADIERVNKLCRKRNNTIYAIPGNHDKKQLFKDLFGTMTNVILPKEFSIHTINNKRVCFGGFGGISIDRRLRRKDVDWWSNEPIGTPPKHFKAKVDILVMHPGLKIHIEDKLYDISRWLENTPNLEEDLEQEQKNIAELQSRVTTPLIICGHYHKSKSVTDDKGTKHVFLDINQVIEVL